MGRRYRDDDLELSWLSDGNNIEPCRFSGVRLRGVLGRLVSTGCKALESKLPHVLRKTGFGPSRSQVKLAEVSLVLRTMMFVEPESPVVSVVVGRIRVPALGPCACRVGSWRVIGSRADK